MLKVNVDGGESDDGHSIREAVEDDFKSRLRALGPCPEHGQEPSLDATDDGWEIVACCASWRKRASAALG